MFGAAVAMEERAVLTVAVAKIKRRREFFMARKNSRFDAGCPQQRGIGH
jgi:hypothetical protein